MHEPHDDERDQSRDSTHFNETGHGRLIYALTTRSIQASLRRISSVSFIRSELFLPLPRTQQGKQEQHLFHGKGHVSVDDGKFLDDHLKSAALTMYRLTFLT